VTVDLDRIVSWATARSDVEAVVLTGSRARPGSVPDEFSDYDIELYTTDRDAYRRREWVAELGPVWVCLSLEDEYNDPSQLVFYEGGVKVDFMAHTVDELDARIAAGELNPLYQRGYRVLVDRNGRAARLRAPEGRSPVRARPTEEEFLATTTEFWFEAMHIPRYLLRNELWLVKSRDWTMKRMLLRMIEWHALAAHGGDAERAGSGASRPGGRPSAGASVLARQASTRPSGFPTDLTCSRPVGINGALQESPRTRRLT
jgi:aminoglycoside 6-adenylyltransferase